MKRLGGESGQTLIMVALSMTVLLGFAGLATDVGVLLHERRLAQTAADSAAIAAAGDLNYGAIDAAAAGKNAASQNGFTDGANGTTVIINAPPSDDSNPSFNTAGFVEAVVSRPVNTIFMGLFGHGLTTVSARAVAAYGLDSASECVIILSPDGSTNSNKNGAGFYLSGASNVNLPKCGIADNSDAGDAFYINGAFNFNVQSINVVGSDSINGAVNWQQAHPSLGAASFSDPLNYLSQNQPSASGCASNPNYSGALQLVLSPGCYNGFTLGGAANVKLNPGVYVINGGGGFNISGAANITGSGVTIYLTNGAGITLAGALNIGLTAPTSGTYNGILFFQDPADSAPLNFTGAANFNSQGIIYLPNADVNWNGAANGAFYTDFVVKTFSDTGALNFADYAVMNTNSPLIRRRIGLVE